MSTGFDVSRLEALLESARLLQSSLEIDVILKHLLRTAMGRLLARRGMIAVRKATGEMRVELARGASALVAGSLYSEEAGRAAGIEQFSASGTGAEPEGVLGIGGLAAGLKPDEAEFLQALLGVAASV